MSEQNADTEEYEFLWRHFVFNAEQRLKAFNFFVVFSVFANGGVFTALEGDAHPAVLILIGGFVCALSVVFWITDLRSKQLIELGFPGLKAYEQRFAAHTRIFTIDESVHLRVGYKFAFRTLFVLQLLFGLGLIGYAMVKWIHASA
jgi:hypothetical protein